MPGAVTHFAGRATELEALTALLDQADESAPATAVISAIGGTAGVGKPNPRANISNRYLVVI